MPIRVNLTIDRKRSDFTRYHNRGRAHRVLGGNPPAPSAEAVAVIDSVTWQSHCCGLYQLRLAA